jgi:REP element-mobilizing transposase RayT
MKPENYKYHLAIRLKDFDYYKQGIYFITVCANRRLEIFGIIEDRQSILSGAGQVADAWWREIPHHFPNASLLDHIVMPNHLHGLIYLRGNENGTACRASTDKNSESYGMPIRGSLPTIIRSYKSAVTKLMHERFPESPKRIWQPGYYEHIIRDEEELKYTINYIEANPANWETPENRICNGTASRPTWSCRADSRRK